MRKMSVAGDKLARAYSANLSSSNWTRHIELVLRGWDAVESTGEPPQTGARL